jgi:hypothetical protein
LNFWSSGFVARPPKAVRCCRRVRVVLIRHDMDDLALALHNLEIAQRHLGVGIEQLSAVGVNDKAHVKGNAVRLPRADDQAGVIIMLTDGVIVGHQRSAPARQLERMAYRRTSVETSFLDDCTPFRGETGPLVQQAQAMIE